MQRYALLAILATIALALAGCASPNEGSAQERDGRGEFLGVQVEAVANGDQFEIHWDLIAQETQFLSITATSNWTHSLDVFFDSHTKPRQYSSNSVSPHAPVYGTLCVGSIGGGDAQALISAGSTVSFGHATTSGPELWLGTSFERPVQYTAELQLSASPSTSDQIVLWSGGYDPATSENHASVTITGSNPFTVDLMVLEGGCVSRPYEYESYNVVAAGRSFEGTMANSLPATNQLQIFTLIDADESVAQLLHEDDVVKQFTGRTKGWTHLSETVNRIEIEQEGDHLSAHTLFWIGWNDGVEIADWPQPMYIS